MVLERCRAVIEAKGGHTRYQALVHNSQKTTISSRKLLLVFICIFCVVFQFIKLLKSRKKHQKRLYGQETLLGFFFI